MASRSCVVSRCRPERIVCVRMEHSLRLRLRLLLLLCLRLRRPPHHHHRHHHRRLQPQIHKHWLQRPEHTTSCKRRCTYLSPVPLARQGRMTVLASPVLRGSTRMRQAALIARNAQRAPTRLRRAKHSKPVFAMLERQDPMEVLAKVVSLEHTRWFLAVNHAWDALLAPTPVPLVQTLMRLAKPARQTLTLLRRAQRLQLACARAGHLGQTEALVFLVEKAPSR
jgi:hypothetical protein